MINIFLGCLKGFKEVYIFLKTYVFVFWHKNFKLSIYSYFMFYLKKNKNL